MTCRRSGWPGAIRVVSKGDKPSVKPMLPELHELLYNYALASTDMKPRSFLLAQKNGKPFTRKMIERRTLAWGRAARVTECNPHRFRHTFATALVEQGVDIRIIQVFMDHADLNTTQV